MLSVGGIFVFILLLVIVTIKGASSTKKKKADYAILVKILLSGIQFNGTYVCVCAFVMCDVWCVMYVCMCAFVHVPQFINSSSDTVVFRCKNLYWLRMCMCESLFTQLNCFCVCRRDDYCYSCYYCTSCCSSFFLFPDVMNTHMLSLFCSLIPVTDNVLSHITHQTSYITHHTSHIIHHTSYTILIHHASYIIHRTSIHHTSRIIHHTSNNIITCV